MLLCHIVLLAIHTSLFNIHSGELLPPQLFCEGCPLRTRTDFPASSLGYCIVPLTNQCRNIGNWCNFIFSLRQTINSPKESSKNYAVGDILFVFYSIPKKRDSHSDKAVRKWRMWPSSNNQGAPLPNYNTLIPSAFSSFVHWIIAICKLTVQFSTSS